MADEIDEALTSVGPRLRVVRERRQATLAQLSQASGISVSTLSRLESGGRKPTLELLLRLARAHEVPVDELISGVKASVAIKIFGDDLDTLKQKAEQAAGILGKVTGATDINVERVSGLAYLQIDIDRPRIARYGINVADINDLIDTAIGGKEASRVFEGQKSFGIFVRFPESQRQDVDRIKRLWAQSLLR